MKEYGGLAQSIIQYSGGTENIIAANNCMTRVRLELADADKAEVDRIKGLKGVLGVNIDAQFQIIVGPGAAAKITEEINKILSPSGAVSNKDRAKEIAAHNKAVIKEKQKVSKGKLLLKTISNIFIPLAPAFIATGLMAGLQSIVGTMISEGMLSADFNQWVTILRVIKAGVLSYLVIYVGINAAREFKTDMGLGGALGAVALLTGMSADAPILNIFTGEALRSGQGGVIGVILAVWILSVIHRKLSDIMPKSIDLIATSFLSLFISALIMIFFIMPFAGWVSDGILFVVTKLLAIGGAFAGFILAAVWLPLVMLGLHHFMTPIHVELINQTGMTILLPILTMAGAGQVGAAFALWFKCRKNKPLTDIIKGGLPAGILGIGEPLIYGVTLPLGKPFITACIGAGFGGAFIGSFGNVGATSIGATGILMIPLIADHKWMIYVGGLLISYAVGFAATYLFGVPAQAQREVTDLEDLEMA